MTKISDFWVLSTNGIPLFFTGEETDKTSQVLISGFFAALQILIQSLDHTQLNKIELENNTYFYYMNHPVISVVKANPKDEAETIRCLGQSQMPDNYRMEQLEDIRNF